MSAAVKGLSVVTILEKQHYCTVCVCTRNVININRRLIIKQLIFSEFTNINLNQRSKSLMTKPDERILDATREFEK